MAGVYDATGQPQRALALYQEALPIRREVGHRAGEATTLNNMALVYRATGQPQRALALYQEALPICREVGDRAGEATTLNNMAGVYFRQGEPDKALNVLRQIVPIAQEIGDRATEAALLDNIATVLLNLNRKREAITYKEQAVAVLEETGLSHDAGSTPLTQIKEELARMRGDAGPPTPSGDPAAISQVIQAVRAFVNAEDWDATRQVVEAQQAVLFQPQVEALFEQNIARARAAGEQRAVEMLELHLALLRQCQAVGLEAAFAQLQAAPREGSADPQLLSTLANNTLAVLGPAAGQRDAWREGLLDLHRQATAQDHRPLLALLEAIIALLDANGDPSGLGQNLDGPYAQTWQAITQQLSQP
jgi:hypothetical protein